MMTEHDERFMRQALELARQALDAATGERRFSSDDLLRLSQEKTRRLGRELGLEGLDGVLAVLLERLERQTDAADTLGVEAYAEGG